MAMEAWTLRTIVDGRVTRWTLMVSCEEVDRCKETVEGASVECCLGSTMLRYETSKRGGMSELM